MLAILLTILKIIGFLLLGILGLLLGILLLVLLVPVHYRFNGSYYGELKGQVKVTWLLHILSVSAWYDKQLSFSVRIFGVLLRERRKKRRSRRVETEEEGFETDLPIPEEDMLTVQSLPEPPKAEEEKQNPLPGTVHKTPRDSSGRKNPILAFIKKIKFFFRRIYDKLKGIKLNIDKIKDWVQDEKNKKLVKLLFKQLKFFFRHILPRKIKGTLTFGFDDPYNTGRVLSYLGLFYPLYYKQFTICPVFDEAAFEGEWFLKGHIRFGTMLLPPVRLFLNKEFRMILRKIMK